MSDDPFGPPEDGGHGQLLLDRPTPPEKPEPAPPVGAGLDPLGMGPAEPVEKPAPRAPVSLRERPLLRFGIAIALGLGAGYLVSQPYAGRVERRVAATRADAVRLRADPEKRDLAPAFDARADREQEQAGTTTGVIWLAVGAAVAGAWVWLTRE